MNRGSRGSLDLCFFVFCPVAIVLILRRDSDYLVILSLAPAQGHSEFLHNYRHLIFCQVESSLGLSQIASLGANNYICQNLKGALNLLIYELLCGKISSLVHKDTEEQHFFVDYSASLLQLKQKYNFQFRIGFVQVVNCLRVQIYQTSISCRKMELGH